MIRGVSVDWNEVLVEFVEVSSRLSFPEHVE
jgi:hypothetical protein